MNEFDNDVLVDLNNNPISIEQPINTFFELKDYENESPIERLERKTNEARYGGTGPDINLVNYVKEKIGSEYITSGSEENPIQIPLVDLNNKQLLDLLKYLEENKIEESDEYDLDDFEIELINAYRSENFDKINQLLGYSNYSQEYSDDEVLRWKLSNMYPDLDESQIQMEIEIMKESPNYEYKLNQARKELSEYISQMKKLEEEEIEQLKSSKIREEYKIMDELIDNISHIHNFIVDDDIKNTVRELIFSDSGKSPLIDLLDTREGLLEVATAYAILPKIAGYVNRLTDEIAELKKQKVVTDGKNYYNSKQNNKYNNKLEDELEDVSDFFFEVNI